MLYYSLSLRSVPQIDLACSASSDKYQIHFAPSKRMEITTVEGAGAELHIGEKIYEVPPKSVFIVMPDMVCDVVSVGGTVHDDTVAVQIEGLEYELLDTEQAARRSVAGEDTVLLPMILPSGDEYANITRLIRLFISTYMRGSASVQCRCLALWFELLACLDTACRNRLMGRVGDSLLPSSQAYVRKAKAFIDRHYHERLRIPDVAEELRITPNYLSSMFKQITGKTVLDYIHMTRIQAVKELLQEPGSGSLADIAVKTGLGTSRNLCSLFKRVCGVSVKEHLRISKELTRYAVAPWDKEEEIFYDDI